MRVLYAAEREIDARLVKGLKELGHVVEVAVSLEDGVELATHGDWQAVFLDGADLTPELAERCRVTAKAAFIFAFVRADDAPGRIALLRAGCDDVFAPPIAISEVAAKLDAMTRRSLRAGPSAQSDVPMIELSRSERSAFVDGRRVALSKREFAVLEALMARFGEVTPAELILATAWSDREDPTPQRLRAQIARLRSKLEDGSPWRLLHAVRGHGYRLAPEPRE
jgi:two-component system, OmpR family, response regulator